MNKIITMGAQANILLTLVKGLATMFELKFDFQLRVGIEGQIK